MVHEYVRELLQQHDVKGISSTELKEFIKTLEIDLCDSQKTSSKPFLQETLKKMALFSVHNFCYTRALDILKESDTRFFSIFKVLHELLNRYVRSYFESMLSLENFVANIKSETVQVERDAINHTSDILSNAELLLEENRKLQEELDSRKREWDSEKKSIQKSLKELEKENKELFERYVKSTKGKDSLLEKAAGMKKTASRETANTRIMATGSVQTGARAKSIERPTARMTTTSRGFASPNLNTMRRSTQFESKNIKSLAVSASQTSLSKQKNSSTTPKMLTLSHLKSMFKEVMASKALHDNKCLTNGLPVETLEQYLFTFLSTKFGLKSLVVEWIESILQGISIYSKEDHDVALFGKMLQNEVDEEFRIVQNEVKKTLVELVKVQLKENNPKKGEKWIISELSKRTEGGSISQEEAEIILEAVLKSEDVPILKSYLQAEVENATVPYRIVERLVLDFFLNKHEKYLSRVKEIFNSLDSDDDGVIDPESFKESLSYVDPMDELKLDGEGLVRLADPNNTGKIPFSKFIEVLSGVKVKSGDGEEISLIQFSKLV